MNGCGHLRGPEPMQFSPGKTHSHFSIRSQTLPIYFGLNEKASARNSSVKIIRPYCSFMTIIALIGADGAGKTTVARRLESELGRRAKYIYLGNNIESANYALPTSRLIVRLKL